MKFKKKTVKKTKTTKKKYYFGKEAHAAIVKYQNSDCNKEKETIYTKDIRPSFDKLTENLIFIHGFSSDKENFSILKNDCVSFLFEILQKFDPSKGSKAFSYFNVCAKNYLIIQSKKRKSNEKDCIAYETKNQGKQDGKKTYC